MASTSAEQYLLELINEARLDPQGNALRYLKSYAPLKARDPDIQNALDFFKVSGSALKAQFSKLKPTDPVGWNDKLATAAEKHNAAMIAADEQSHQLPGEQGLGERVEAAGYNLTRVGENVFAFADNPLFAHAGFMVDWGNGPGGMQSPAGHRLNIMSADFREVGLAITAENNPSTDVGPQVVTQDFGSRGESTAFVLGVAYTDRDKDDFYSIGEGRSGLKVSVGGKSATSSSSGGYAVETGKLGDQTVTLSGGGLKSSVKVTTDLDAGENVKLDVVGGTMLKISTSATIVGKVAKIDGIGATGLTLTTDNNDHALLGTIGADRLKTGSGDDLLAGGRGKDVLTGGKGDDAFLFDSTPGASVIDRITDFRPADDTLRLENAIFKGLAVGTLKKSAFKDLAVAGAKVDADDRILYNHDTGKLFYDADGKGSAKAVQFALLDTDPTLTHADVFIV